MVYDRIFKEYGYHVDWDYVESIPEFAKLKECEQNPVWHGEGNAWEHTKLCVEAAYDLLLTDKYDILEPQLAVAAVLFHDIGKIATTEFLKGAWHAYNHEYKSESIARRLLWNSDFFDREGICTCARYHMKVLNLATSKNVVNEMLKMSRLPFAVWRYLLFVKHCDILGSKPMDEKQTALDIEKIDALYQIANGLSILDGEFPVQGFAKRLVFTPNKPINWKGKEEKRKVVYMLIGLPGAGKNTWVKGKDVVTISRDDIRHELGYCEEGEKVVLTPVGEEHVTDVFNKKFSDALKGGKDIVLNNLNIRKKYRDALKSLAAAHDVLWVYVYVEAPSIQSNLDRRPTFDPDTIVAMTEILEWPQPDEYDELIISKQ